ncbi:MAG: glucose 1-dehydrogenase [Dehalococcoidia bacterium]|jgi:NAD(P)-dependent dehydrogenase (short-subunit alcohol dehydrogenase family)|nr:glucose 1-dehydrogenase [Dehalococcoidia bacterium]
MSRFSGKVALITGAASAVEGELMGFGGRSAWRMLREGGRVVIADIADERGEKAVTQMRDAGLDAAYLHLDVTSESDWSAAVGNTVSRFGRLDILVNVPGTSDRGSIIDTDTDTWQGVMDVSNRGMFLGARSVAPAMRDSGGGAIVNVASMAARYGSEYGAAYSASRSAIIAFGGSAAVQFAPMGIRVNSVLPGWTHTPFTDQIFNDADASAMRINRTPLKRWGQPEEIAAGILFLCSDDASFITGTELVIDGGVTAALQ